MARPDPSPLDAVDYRRFIDLALQRAGHTRKALATALGRSAPWVSQVLSHQRNFDPELLEPLARALDLSDDEHTHLAALLDLEAPSPRARRTAWATVQANRAHRGADELSDEIVAMISRWWIPAILDLARCEGFRPDPAWIADTMVPRLTVEQADEALQTLVDLGMLAPDDTGRLAPRDEAPLWSPSDVPRGDYSRAMQQAHDDLLAIAKRSLHTHWQNERHHAALTFSVSEDHYPRLVARMAELERELVMLATEDPGPRNRVYTLGLFLVPLSDYSDSGPADADDQST